jgi:hypothetical protein
VNQPEPKLNGCGCRGSMQTLTPTVQENRPGLPALSYRVGTHAWFKASMLAGLASQQRPALRGLTTRHDDDPSIALIDAWATTLDVLGFYQERIANEGFLRTATERRSVLELARSLGYELRSGVAAGTYLAFTLETAPGAPRQVIIGIGAKTQSVPEQGEQAQTFETVEEIVARPEWNKLRPRQTQPQSFVIKDQKLLNADTKSEVRSLYCNGTTTGLAPGDMLLVTTGAEAATKVTAKRVLRVKPDGELKRTLVEIEPGGAASPELPEAKPPTNFDVVKFPLNAPPIPFTQSNIKNEVLARRLRERDLQNLLQLNRWNADDLTQFVAKMRATSAVPNQSVLAFRERLGFFGHNAPHHSSLRSRFNQLLFPVDWDGAGWPIWHDYPNTAFYSNGDAFLERAVAGIVQDSWALFSAAGLQRVYRVTDVNEASLVAFAMSGKATGLTLKNANGSSINKADSFLVRKSTAYVKSEELELAALPVPDVIDQDTKALTLDQMVLGLHPGQFMVLSGEQQNASGVTRSELLELQEIIHHDGLTTLLFREQSSGKGLRYSYVRRTVTLNANVARATHGETKAEVLGSGDASQPFEKFTLKQAPLTYVSAATPSGGESTLQVRVNDVLWEEAPSFYRLGAKERKYIVRLGDNGKASVQFGDGRNGLRLPTGLENLRATYRVGVGLAGNVKADQLSTLMTRPLGVKSATNPLPASGGDDPEKLEQARENAPLTVLTLERIVSLQDYADFARAFSGIGKAQATWVWSGTTRLVLLTVAAADGTEVTEDSKLFENLARAINEAREPTQRLQLASFQPRPFKLQAKVLVDRLYLKEKVHTAVTTTLTEAFSFAPRRFGQAVTASEVLSVAQSVEGVVAVDLDFLHLVDQPPAVNDRLPANIARWDEAGRKINPAELLTLAPGGITLLEMKP